MFVFSFFSVLQLGFCCADIQHLWRFPPSKRVEVVFAKTAVDSETMHLLRPGGWLDDLVKHFIFAFVTVCTIQVHKTVALLARKK